MRLAVMVCIALAATAASAQVADGTYESPACSAAGVSDMRITVQGDAIAFYESLCRLGPGTPVAGLDGAMLYDATCNGEGETWRRTMLLMPGFDGALIRVESGLAVTYALCGKVR